MEFRIERGNPTDEELAAIVGVLFTRGSARAADAEVPPASRWAASARPGTFSSDGRPACPAPDGWRASGLPR